MEKREDVGREDPPSYIEATGISALDPGPRAASYENRESKGSTSSTIINDHSFNSSTTISSGPSTTSTAPIKFTVHVRKPLLGLGNPIITIVPTSAIPGVAFYQVRYTNRFNATLCRHVPSPQSDADRPEVAEFNFPEDIYPGCGPIIRYQPHEAEMRRRGARHTSRTDVFMWCTGWFTTRYKVDFPPGLGRMSVAWRVAEAKEQEELSGKAWPPNPPTPVEKAHSSDFSTESEGVTVQMSQGKTAKERSWTPFPLQVLSRDSGEVLATYARAAPWSNVEGWLTIPHLPEAERVEYTKPELVEAVVTVCAAMVGMQDRIGVACSVIEAGFDSVRYGKGKGKAS